ncbi:hypothetical protein NEUTE1DRAFT_44693 [Neurospora tetrasperma FGSC 2508]|uniref:Uncharacterized protein n=1 Tax=Neurospora tetrasperma (strain FGSC 2508 / ATCC MYA-4615 / P0657) TaxID=510951 RepID=F8MP81_NEUT8|nr:uncharacterized protein NEUTE1DRAFT_44693 [Neurospora tetrasperma FGSC 2508]EGO57093.1 hypothetical protein NEUTE1DRAFT_44693 [Neurospora tetrasperma FGSC 2508]EGZ69991.1 hypothetical protein NEUTE2DRAFT_68033 [Neurospora tetrasperma FGSC 2509]
MCAHAYASVGYDSPLQSKRCEIVRMHSSNSSNSSSQTCKALRSGETKKKKKTRAS